MHIASWPIASLFLHTASECSFVLYSDTSRLIWGDIENVKMSETEIWRLQFLNTSIGFISTTLCTKNAWVKGIQVLFKWKLLLLSMGRYLENCYFIKVSDGALGHFVQNNFLSIYRLWMLFRCRTVDLGSLKLGV